MQLQPFVSVPTVWIEYAGIHSRYHVHLCHNLVVVVDHLCKNLEGSLLSPEDTHLAAGTERHKMLRVVWHGYLKWRPPGNMVLCVHTPLLMVEGIGIWQHRAYPAVGMVGRVDLNGTCSKRLPRFLPSSGRAMRKFVMLETEFS